MVWAALMSETTQTCMACRTVHLQVSTYRNEFLDNYVISFAGTICLDYVCIHDKACPDRVSVVSRPVQN